MNRFAVAIMCLLLVIAVPLAAAGHGDSTAEADTEAGDDEHEANETDDREEDEQETEETEQEREINIDVDADRVRIESTFEQEQGESEQEDEFELDFSVQMDPRIELNTESKTETAATEQENESEYKVRFLSLVEFVDENGNGVYDDGENVSAYDLSEATYEDISYNTQTVDGITIHVVEATTTDEVFTIRLHAVGDFTNIDGEQVAPTETKIDLEMHDYNFSEENSELALQTETESETKTEVEQEDSDEETVVRSSDSSGNSIFFSWKNTAQVDGETTPVRSTDIESNGNEQEFYLIYDQGSSIIHDPKIGIESAQSNTGGILNWIVSFFQNLF